MTVQIQEDGAGVPDKIDSSSYAQKDLSKLKTDKFSKESVDYYNNAIDNQDP